MTASYRWVQWNTHKKIYDLILVSAIALYIATFVAVSAVAHRSPRDISGPIVVMRALGSLAIILLHVIISIGPLSRFTNRVAPLLYNRRHLGVAFFFVALAHSAIAIGFYGGFGVRNPIAAMLTSSGSFASISGFPFEALGFLALLIFFIMAATSHDFWLANLSPRLWKSLHMLVYVAYALVVLHVALGPLQSERSALYPTLLVAGAVWVVSLHVVAGWTELRREAGAPLRTDDGQWVDACSVDDIGEGAGKVIAIKGRERIAVFRFDGKIAAVSNVCAHQSGPLGEGRIVEGCITCPWHGYQYLPETGYSPPPYTERIATYSVRVRSGRVLIDPKANPLDSPVRPALIAAEDGERPS